MMRRGFTLIELLVVVAIISILASIAVPNFLEAQTRAKVSAVKNNMRVLAVTLEVYNVDYNKYPTGFTRFLPLSIIPGGTLSWPAYPDTSALVIGEIMQLPAGGRSSQLMDILLRDKSDWNSSTGGLVYYNHRFMSEIIAGGASWQNLVPDNWRIAQELAGEYSIHSVGPTGIDYTVNCFHYGGVDIGSEAGTADAHGEKALFREYDATNGTVSAGYVYRTQRNSGGLGVHPRFYETN